MNYGHKKYSNLIFEWKVVIKAELKSWICSIWKLWTLKHLQAHFCRFFVISQRNEVLIHHCHLLSFCLHFIITTNHIWQCRFNFWHVYASYIYTRTEYKFPGLLTKSSENWIAIMFLNFQVWSLCKIGTNLGWLSKGIWG